MVSAVRHIPAVRESEYFLAAEFENNVHLYRKGRKEKEKQIQTHLDFGGNRLQLVPENESLIAGAYRFYGIECYLLNDGILLWKRKDLRKVQNIRKEPKAGRVSCFFEDRAGVILDCQTGEGISNYRGVKDIYFSPYNSLVLEEGAKYKVKAESNLLFTIDPESFAILDAVFSPAFLAITESGANLRIFSVENGKLMGKFIPNKGYHILNLVYNPYSSLFIGLLWGYESAGDYYLIHLSEEAEEKKRFPVSDGYVCAFFPERKTFLNASGLEIDWDTGEEIFHYDFPMRKEKSKTTAST